MFSRSFGGLGDGDEEHQRLSCMAAVTALVT